MTTAETVVESGAETARAETRKRIIAAATKLLAEHGPEALTTRAVAAEAGVQAPTLYRLFGDKTTLIDAVGEHGFAAYLAGKVVRATEIDPVEDLRAGWDLHVGFGLANPALYTVMNAPRPGVRSPALEAGKDILQARIHRIALAGRLRVSEQTASHLVHAAGHGTVLALLTRPEPSRDPDLSVTAREAVIAAISTDEPVVTRPGPAAAAIALRAALPATTVLTDAEQRLLEEWLDRLAAAHHG